MSVFLNPEKLCWCTPNKPYVLLNVVVLLLFLVIKIFLLRHICSLLSFLPYEIERNLWKAKERMLKFHCRVLDQMPTLTLNTELQVQFAFLAFKTPVWVRQSFSFQAPSSASSDGSSVL